LGCQPALFGFLADVAFKKFSAFDSIEDSAWQTGGEVAYAADYARGVESKRRLQSMDSAVG
jgi:hypothetical protein